MDACRICLASKTDKDIFQSPDSLMQNEKSFSEILMFCLEIQVVNDLKISTKVCLKCYKKVLSFHKFKSLALKNDDYWKSMLEEINVKNEVFIREEVKSEQLSVCDDSESGSLKEEVGDDVVYLKNEDPEEFDPDDVFLSVIKSMKYEHVDKNENKTKVRGKRERKPKHAKSKALESIPQMCEECGKTVKDLKAHSLQHLPAAYRKKYKCKSCDKTFSSKSSCYKHHKIKHLGLKKKCNICNKAVVNLRQHNRIMHNKDSLPIQCVPCGRRFISKSTLELHMTTHTKDRPVPCPECGKGFQTRPLMLLHKRQVHDKEKSHLCQLCPKRFFKKYHLQQHLRSHTKEKPVECPDCGKFFSSTTTMKSHRELHDEGKSYACSLCDMTFKKKNYLNVHMISHTKEKRHACQYCGVKFGRSDHRKRHERTAHEKILTS